MSNIDIILGRCDELIEEANGIIERKEDLKVYYISYYQTYCFSHTLFILFATPVRAPSKFQKVFFPL